MRDHKMLLCHKWSTCMIFLVLLLSFVVMNVLVLANVVPDSLQHQQSLCHNHEKLALLHFKQSFLINWSASDPAFAHPKVKSWLQSSSSDDHHVSSGASDCCRWDGVSCNEETGHVVGLDLSSSCLSGTFPQNSTIFSLKHLQELDLSDNDFNYSRIPSAIQHLSKLTRLNLSQSDFSGPIPLGISRMSHLSVLDLSSDIQLLELQHDIMSFEKLIGNLTYLIELRLDYVDISDVVPVSLRNSTSLRSFSFQHCNLYGDFTTEIFRLPKLEEVKLESNPDLGGHLPEFPPNRPLKMLDLWKTSFSGKFTPSIGNLANLTELILGRTSITGSIPFSLGNLTKLTFLDFYDCNFEGDLPLSITNLTQLTHLSLSNIPVRPQTVNSWLLKLSKLEHLDLINMNISSEFPPAVANLTKLQWLEISGNQLRCSLPNWLANLTQLSHLDLTGNQLQGSLIPGWFSQLMNLDTLFLDSDQSPVAMFDPLIKLSKLNLLAISGVNLIFPPDNVSKTNHSSFPKFYYLQLRACNLTEFPQFLRYQSELNFLDLSINNIAGLIPQWLVNTTKESLLNIELSSNFITSFEELPQGFLPWDKLEMFSVRDNKLQGQLPSPPPSLRIYHVSQNHLSGVVPGQICEASSLFSLDVSSNKFNGHIPSCIGHQLGASLRILNMGSNHLQGTIPQTFTKACKLQMINLSENELEGQLPKSLTNCRELELLNVGKNCLNDTFPSWLGSLPKLRIIVLRHNNFHGRIETVASDHPFHHLRIVDLSNNSFDGELPSVFLQNLLAMQVTSEGQRTYSSSSKLYFYLSPFFMELDIDYPFSINITNKGTERSFPEILTVFRAFDISSNKLTGVIPQVLGKLRGLQALNLSNNNLVGDIPSSLANIMDLESLDLSQNMLTGQIPQQLTELTFLEIFNVSHNRLVGLIPQGNQFSSYDNSSFDGNLALCGAPLSKKCRTTDHSPQPSPSNTGDETEEDSMLIDWIIRLLGCASGCIVGFIIGKIYITDRHHDWFVETFGRRTIPKPKAKRSARRIRRHG